MARLAAQTQHMGAVDLRMYDREPKGSPLHSDVPYAFKGYALKDAGDRGADLLIWADACILPIRSMEPLWERIERDGALIWRNGYTNAQWMADSAYPDLFPDIWADKLHYHSADAAREAMREANRVIPHVVATCVGLNVRHPVGRGILDEYYRLASETRAFCGPWKNIPETPCGPPEVLGHRHDQSSLSVLAARFDVQLIDAPWGFAYGKAGDQHHEDTIVIADGSYE